jgi:competence protein ComEC
MVAKPKTLEPHNGKKFFDYTSYLATRNVGSEMYYPHVEVIDEEAHDVTSYLGRLKESLVKKINFYVSSPSSELATGMLFGNSSMSDELVQVFRTAGLSHIIVLSGFNIAVVIAFVLLVFSFLPLVLRIFLASITVILFVMMVGGEASVIRATLMAFVSLLATLVGRKYVAHQALILSLFVIVMYEPQALLYDASLHLSFLATVGIVYLVPGLDRYLAGIQSITLRELCATTIAAYLSTLPYIMYTFGTVSTYALIANIFVLPLVPFAMLVSFVLVIMSFISETITVLIGYVDTFLISGMIFVADVIEYLPFASIGISITRNEMLLIYLVLISGVVFLFSKKENETRVMSAGDKEEEFLTDIIKF